MTSAGNILAWAWVRGLAAGSFVIINVTHKFVIRPKQPDYFTIFSLPSGGSLLQSGWLIGVILDLSSRKLGFRSEQLSKVTLGVYSSVRSGSTSTSLLQSWLVFFWGSWESLLLTSFFTTMLSRALQPQSTHFMHFFESKRRWKHRDYVCAHVPYFIKDHLVSNISQTSSIYLLTPLLPSLSCPASSPLLLHNIYSMSRQSVHISPSLYLSSTSWFWTREKKRCMRGKQKLWTVDPDCAV